MRRRLELGALLVAVAAILAAAAALVASRFARGDTFPDGSSLSTAPRGTRALAESLARLPGVEVGRALRATELEGCAGGCTVLLLGVSTWQLLDAATLERLDQRLRSGARVVLAFAPVERREQCGACGGAEDDEPDAGAAREPAASRPEDARPRPPARSVPAWWRQIELGFLALPESDGEVGAARLTAAAGEDGAGLERVGWRSAATLARLPDGARTLWSRDGVPVAAELEVGRGRLLIVTDRTPFTNQALRQERATAALRTLLGGSRRVLFEETHLGVVRAGGVTVLVRRYRLTGALLGLVGLALLWVWRVANPLAPPGAPAPAISFGASPRAGRDAAAGLIGLYRRGIPPRALLGACVEAWRGSPAARPSAPLAAELSELARAAGDAAAGYQTIRSKLNLPET